MKELHGSLVFVPRKRRAQESVQWYLHHRETCWLEAREDFQRGGFALFCRGEHCDYIGHITMWRHGRALVEVVGFQFCRDNRELFERLYIVTKDDLREFYRESV